MPDLARHVVCQNRRAWLARSGRSWSARSGIWLRVQIHIACAVFWGRAGRHIDARRISAPLGGSGGIWTPWFVGTCCSSAGKAGHFIKSILVTCLAVISFFSRRHMGVFSLCSELFTPRCMHAANLGCHYRAWHSSSDTGTKYVSRDRSVRFSWVLTR